MATAPATYTSIPSAEFVASLPTIAFNRFPDDYFVPTRRALDGTIVIAERYSHLSAMARAYAIATALQGIPEYGKRVSNCCHCGALFAKSEDNSLGLAAKFACGEQLGCPNCGKGEYRYADWMYTRDEDRILSEPQVGIELSLPLNSAFYSESWLNVRPRLRKLGKRLARKLGVKHSVMRDAVPSDAALLRMAISIERVDRDQVRALLDRLSPFATIRFHGAYNHGATGKDAKKILQWVFSGWESALEWPASEQAAMRKQIGRRHLTSSTGDHYRALTPEEVKRRHAEQRKQAIEAMESRKGIKLIYIPREHRIVEPCDDMEARIGHVIYCRELNATYRYRPNTYKCAPDRASP